jgi:hypothetical protein
VDDLVQAQSEELERTVTTGSQCHQTCRDNLLDWFHAQKKHSKHQQQNPAMECYVWTKPARGTLECNVDTTCYDEQNLYCVGACMRDDKGGFIEAIMRNYRGKPLIAEA